MCTSHIEIHGRFTSLVVFNSSSNVDPENLIRNEPFIKCIKYTIGSPLLGLGVKRVVVGARFLSVAERVGFTSSRGGREFYWHSSYVVHFTEQLWDYVFLHGKLIGFGF